MTMTSPRFTLRFTSRMTQKLPNHLKTPSQTMMSSRWSIGSASMASLYSCLDEYASGVICIVVPSCAPEY